MDSDFIKTYSKYLLKDGYQRADELKNATIPNILYKYFPCTENRINSLSKRELWLAQRETFNDPNEFRFMFIDKEKFDKAELIDPKWDFYNYDQSFFKVEYQDALKFMEITKKLVSISCLTTDPQSDYFWSEYANDQNGFCVEYVINKKDNFYPVIYTNEKIEISDILKTTIMEFKKVIEDEYELERIKGQKYNIVSEDGMKYISFLYFNYCCKEIKWKHENEYRIIFANSHPQISKGKLVSYNDLNITANKIFIGNNCSDIDKKKLKLIAESRGIEYSFN